MDSGRRRLTKTLLTRQQGVQPDLELIHRASQQAVARFWDLLQDFCGLGIAPPAWQAVVVEGHPFFFWQPDLLAWQVAYQ